MLFFKSFIENIQNEKNIISNNNYYNKFFRSFIIENFKKKFKHEVKDDDDKISNTYNINIICNFLIPYLNKPQRLIQDNKDYYIAIDMLTNIKYICFKDLCVLDFDINKNNYKCKDDILKYINNNSVLNNITYYRIETERGYHIYLIDKPRNYSQIETFYFINQFDCDDYYKFYCYLRGFSIRLSFKSNDTYIYKNIKLINNNKNLTEFNNTKFDKDSLRLRNLFFYHLQFFDKN